jgi:hypothetical protein
VKNFVRPAFLALFALSLSLSISGAQIFGSLVLILWAVRATRTRTPWKRSSLDIPLLVFYLWMVATALIKHTTDPWDAVMSPSAFLCFLWASQDLEEGELNFFLRWFCIGAAVAGAWGILQVVGGIDFLPNELSYRAPSFADHWPAWAVRKFALRNGRAVGTRGHPLTYAEGFIPAVFIFLAWALEAFHKKDFRRSAWLGAGILLVAGGVLFAAGRAVWIGIGLGLLVFFFVRRRAFSGRAAFALFLLLLLPLASPRIRGRLFSTVSPTAGSLRSLNDQLSKDTRFDLWRAGLEQWKLHPIAGVGFKGARLVAIDPVTSAERVWTETHDMFLQNAVELGFIGLGLFLWVLVVSGKIIDGVSVFWRPVFWGMFAAFMVAGLTESWPRDKEIAMIFWLMIGLAQKGTANEKA